MPIASSESTHKAQKPSSKIAQPQASPVDAMFERALYEHRGAIARQAMTAKQKVCTDQNLLRIWNASIRSSEGYYEEAAAEFERTKYLESGGSAACLAMAAQAYANIRDMPRAIQLATLSINRQATEYNLDVRAGCYMDVKRFTDAAKDFEQAAKLREHYAHMYLCKASAAYIQAKQYSNALKAAESAVHTERGNEDPFVPFSKARALIAMGRDEEAIQSLNQSIEEVKKTKENDRYRRSGSLCTFLKERIKCYQRLGKTKEAKSDEAQLEKISTQVEDELFK